MKTTAIILAAGRGRRLSPLTNRVPKCLLKVGGIEILEHQIINLTSYDINQIIFCIGYKENILKKRINELCRKYNLEPYFVINHQYLKTNTLYSLYLCTKIKISDYVLLNGDVVFDKKILELLLSKTNRSFPSLAIEIKKTNEEDVKVQVDKKKEYILHIGKGIKNNDSFGEFTGIAYFPKKYSMLLHKILAQLVLNNKKQEYFEFAIEKTINEMNSKIKPIDIKQNKFIEIDTLNDYAGAQRKFAI